MAAWRLVEPYFAMIAPNSDREALQELLRQYNECPDRRASIEREIRRRFERSLAILVLDSSGFSRTTRSMGIVHFLALLERLGQVAQPIVQRHGGRILRTEADNLFATFPTAGVAASCALEIHRALSSVNGALSSTEELSVAIGIGFGSVLAIGDDDLYGDEMNLACKLGEDLAQRGEVLLTEGARAALDLEGVSLEELNFSISGLALTAYRLKA